MAEEICEYLSQVFAARPPGPAEIPAEIARLTTTTPAEDNPFAAAFQPEEVWERLRRCGNTAPGPDGIRYSVWKKKDIGGVIMAAVFNAVQRIIYYPAMWRRSKTLLIYKKGDRSSLANWRPISLSDTLAKTYASVLASRLGRWASGNGKISTAQKGFMAVDGCSEHNFLLQSVIADARQNRKECAVAWLDLTNAFGSVPHNTIFGALRWAGLGEEAIGVIRRAYDGCSTTIRGSDGQTDDIPIGAGVKQGCPLSPIVFNLALEPLLRAIANHRGGYGLAGGRVDVLAYADDLALVGSSSDELHSFLTTAGKVADWAGLAFNARKCASLHIRGWRSEVLPTPFSIQGEEMLTMGQWDAYEHLGVPTGYQAARSADEAILKMGDHLERVHASLLAPWQKADAVNTFILSTISFHRKNGVVSKRPLNALNLRVKKYAKAWLNLPQRAGVEPLYLSYQDGGLGLVPLGLMADVSQIVHGLRLLHSRDLGPLATSLLGGVVRRRLRRPPARGEVAEFLNGSMARDFAKESVEVTNVWTRLRTATRRLRAKVEVEWTSEADSIQLQLDGATVEPKRAEYTLRRAVREYFKKRLLAKPDQGKTYGVTRLSQASNNFMRAGDFMRFADWRFIHRARLDCVPLNGTRRFGSGDKRCRRCGHGNETLPHVLCHCRPNFAAITRRHNAILDRLVKAAKFPATAVVRINQTVPGIEGGLRPDFVAIDEDRKSVTIVDVTVPFENRYAAFEAARAEKIEKYREIGTQFSNRGYEVFVDAFVVGALGAWDPANEPVLRQLGIGARYARLMRRLLCVDAIRWSRDIYTEHVTGAKQYE